MQDGTWSRSAVRGARDVMEHQRIPGVVEWKDPELKIAERRGFWKGVVTMVVAAALWVGIILTAKALF